MGTISPVAALIQELVGRFTIPPVFFLGGPVLLSPMPPSPPIAPVMPVTPRAPAPPRPPAPPSPPDPRREQEAVDPETGPQSPSDQQQTLQTGQNLRQGPAALRIALGQVGIREEPPGSNRGPQVDQYTGGRAEPWCAHFVSWCFEQAGSSPLGHQSYVPTLREIARRRGVYHPMASVIPEPGDVLTMARYDRLGTLVGGHTGFIVEYQPNAKTISTVEGNLGDGVRRNVRPLTELDGLIRI